MTFRPPFRGTITGAVTITDSAPSSPQKVPLTGVGTAVSLQPLNLDFGDQQLGTTSPPQGVTLTNYATSALLISRIRIVGRNGYNPKPFAQTNNCGKSVPAKGSCTISVTFTPEYPAHNNATLDVYDNGGASPQTVALSGNGTE